MKTSVRNLKVRSKEDDTRINLIEKLIKLGFSPEEAKEIVEEGFVLKS